jgi:Fe-S oxidoreductase
MTPNKAMNWCCGGGGGVVAVPEFTEAKRIGGKMKVEQIRATGAQVVTATCDNCKLQLDGLNETYKMGVRIEGVMDPVSRALIFKS